MVPAVWRIVSPLDQTAHEFWAKNRGHLLLSAIGGGAILLGALGLGPRMLYGPLRQSPRFNIRAAPRRLLPHRIAGVAVLVGSLPFYRYSYLEAVARRTGLGQSVALLAALGATFAALLMLERRRSRRLLDDLSLRVPRRELILLGAFLTVWFCAMAWRLDTRPGFFHGDEATVVMYGRAAYIHSKDKPRSPLIGYYAPTLGCVPRALAFEAWRSRPYLGPRLVTLATSTFGMMLIFAFARNKVGRMGAWVAVFIAATHHLWIAFSRMGILSADGATLITLCVVAWLAAHRTRRRSFAFLAGALGGLSYYTYHGAMLVIPLIAALTVLDVLIQPRRIMRRWSLILFLAVGLSCAEAPFKIYYRGNPAGAEFRQLTVSMIYSNNFQRELTASKANTLPRFFLKRAWVGAVGSLIWPDTSSNYQNFGSPILDRGLLALFLAAALACIPLLRTVRLFTALFLWIALTLLLGAMFAGNPDPPYAPRIYMMLPALYIMVGWFVSMVIGKARRIWGNGAALVPLGAAAVLLGSAARVNLHGYFGFYLRNIDVREYHVIPTGMMDWMNRYPQDASLVFAAPHAYQTYSAYMEMFDGPYERVILTEPLGVEIPEPKNPHGVAYVFKRPEFAALEAQFTTAHPGEVPTLITNPYVKDPPMFAVYWLHPTAKGGNKTKAGEGKPADEEGGPAPAASPDATP